MPYNSCEELSRDLCNFTYDMLNNLDMEKEVNVRVFYSRLYYALFHKILDALGYDKYSNVAKLHEKIRDILFQHMNENNTYRMFYQTFIELKDLRVWADYKVKNSIPNTNYKYYQYKVYKLIHQNLSL